jgi:hypothetical protein
MVLERPRQWFMDNRQWIASVSSTIWTANIISKMPAMQHKYQETLLESRLLTQPRGWRKVMLSTVHCVLARFFEYRYPTKSWLTCFQLLEMNPNPHNFTELMMQTDIQSTLASKQHHLME